MTIKKKQQINLISNHGVRKFWIYWTFHLLITWSELSDLPWNFLLLGMVILITDVFVLFLQMRKENSGFYGIFQIFPETQAKLPKPS